MIKWKINGYRKKKIMIYLTDLIIIKKCLTSEEFKNYINILEDGVNSFKTFPKKILNTLLDNINKLDENSNND